MIGHLDAKLMGGQLLLTCAAVKMPDQKKMQFQREVIFV